MTDLPPLSVLAALLHIDPDDPADADVAALADLLVRRELRALRDDLPPPPPRLHLSGEGAARIGVQGRCYLRQPRRGRGEQ